MTMEEFKRKLTTIFSADVEGYSRLMAQKVIFLNKGSRALLNTGLHTSGTSEVRNER